MTGVGGSTQMKVGGKDCLKNTQIEFKPNKEIHFRKNIQITGSVLIMERNTEKIVVIIIFICIE